jgi:hypothetical protein
VSLPGGHGEPLLSEWLTLRCNLPREPTTPCAGVSGMAGQRAGSARSICILIAHIHGSEPQPRPGTVGSVLRSAAATASVQRRGNPCQRMVRLLHTGEAVTSSRLKVGALRAGQSAGPKHCSASYPLNRGRTRASQKGARRPRRRYIIILYTCSVFKCCRGPSEAVRFCRERRRAMDRDPYLDIGFYPLPKGGKKPAMQPTA